LFVGHGSFLLDLVLYNFYYSRKRSNEENDSVQLIGICADSYTCSIDSSIFCLAVEEIGEQEIEKGDWVEFILIGLSLFDVGT
jgi:hypothetical protein